jgi:hypothetical protein
VRSEQDVLLTSGTHSIPSSSTGWGIRVALLLLLVLLGIAAMLVVLRWDGGTVSSWLLPSPAALLPVSRK